MFYRKATLYFFLCLLLFFTSSGLILADGVTFIDFTNLFSTNIPDRWVYQSHHSSDSLTVFYGEDDYDLLYFENLGLVLDNSVQEFAKRTLDLYKNAGGLDKFKIERPLAGIDIAGQWGLSCIYTYEDIWGNRLWEYRLFVLLPDSNGFSLALGRNSNVVSENALMDYIIGHWRWLF